MNICIFEDGKFGDFFPITLSRPIFELRTGTSSIYEKILHFFPGKKVFLKTRPYLEKTISGKRIFPSQHIPSEPALFFNGRLIPDKSLKQTIELALDETLFFSEDTLIAAKVRDARKFLRNLEKNDFNTFKKEKISAKTVEYLWDLLKYNGEEIKKEFSLFGNKAPLAQENIIMLEEENIFTGDGVTIMPWTVLDAQDGPIIIDNGTTVMANSFLKGPLYIGKNCVIKAGTRIYGPTSIGDVCKIGGELTATIFQGFSNKQHEGFIGHSYIGEWVNIGADTNNSDLKNNYKEVTVYINNKPVKTGLTFVGTFIGDHSKTAINTVINTGTVIGFSSNIFGEGFPPKFVPSFSWGGKRKFSTYKIDDAIETARKVMERRNVTMTEAYRKMMIEILELTKTERVWA